MKAISKAPIERDVAVKRGIVQPKAHSPLSCPRAGAIFWIMLGWRRRSQLVDLGAILG